MRKVAIGIVLLLFVLLAVGKFTRIQFEAAKEDKKSPNFIPYAVRIANAEKIEWSWRASLDDPKHAMPVVPSEITAAESQAHSIPKDEPEYVRAQEVLARLTEDGKRRNAEAIKEEKAKQAEQAKANAEAKKVAEAAMKQMGPTIRRELAKTFEHEFLMRNMDVTFTAEGKDATTLHFKYVLVGRPLAEQLRTDGTFLRRCGEAGFTFVILDNGFGKTFTFTL